MGITLDSLIVVNRESLVDRIVKDAIGQIPSYAKAPLRVTIERIEQGLDALADSIRENDPDILEQHLVGVATERRREEYAVLELHTLISLYERHLRDDVLSTCTDEVECNALLALLDAVMESARMVLSVRYMVIAMEARTKV
jgi:hypothetical protein